MAVKVIFQSPDYSPVSHTVEPELTLTFDGVDLDHGFLTVYAEPDLGMNWTLAESAPMCNEDGRPLGGCAWKIQPDDQLSVMRPDLHQYIGYVYGRVIVVAADQS